MHQDVSGGTYIFSGKDLVTLYSMFINNRMVDPATFRYLVVSSFGVGTYILQTPLLLKNLEKTLTRKAWKIYIMTLVEQVII
jgi:hypothetical protein